MPQRLLLLPRMSPACSVAVVVVVGCWLLAVGCLLCFLVLF